MYPARYTVQVLPYEGTTADDYGNETASWGQAEDRKVYGWAPGGGVEVNGWRHAVTADLSLLAPPGFDVKARDRVVVDGSTYDVDGIPEDYTHGPFGFRPGVVVNLRRVEV